MDYAGAIAFIQDTQKFGSRLGLESENVLLKLMGDPHKKLKYVHVAGTNGKGSTVTFISSILISAGYRTGIYTSPFIGRFNERIRIDREDIGDDDLAEDTSFVKEKVDEMLTLGYEHPTEFEIVTAIGFWHFFRKKCDVVVLEVGMGGRFDATNVIDTPDLAVITTISYDHTDRLGNTLELIAFEKAGIIKPNGDVLVYPQTPTVREVFAEACRSRGARMLDLDLKLVRVEESSIERQVFDYDGLTGLEIFLIGPHQTKNAALAVKSVKILAKKGYRIGEQDIFNGLAKARWPGRFEVLRRSPLVVVDGAHNIEGAQALAATIGKVLPERRIVFIFGVLKDRDYMTMIKPILPFAQMIITVTPPKDTARSAQDLADGIGAVFQNVIAAGSVEEAYKMAIEAAGQDGTICAFGSLYYIGELRNGV